ncbi:MAG: hypothetical protein R2783_10000 [Gelidibacter sp.]
MKNLFLLSLCIFVFVNHLEAQTYEFLNDALPTSEHERIYLKSEFESLNNEKFIKFYLTKNFIEENWEPLPSNHTPDLSLFLKNVSFEHIRAIVLTSIPNERIDFNQLKPIFVKVEDLKEHLIVNDMCHIISKPIFSCDNEWAIIYKYSAFKTDVGNSGILLIYKKTEKKWKFYHKITLWIS